MSGSILMPTTTAQISGHRFLWRRIEHGLVLGDVRMIHDPLSKRRRAQVFGLVASGLIAIGAVALALFRPAIDPGDALLIRAESGAHYVRLDETIHPVVNVASARLILGDAVEPVAASDTYLAEMSKGVPLGIVDAPGVINADETAEVSWLMCQSEDSGDISIAVIDSIAENMADGQALLAVDNSSNRELTWHIIANNGRTELPAPDSVHGRIIRRELDIDSTTPILHITSELLNTIPELPPIVFPEPIPEIIRADSRSWVQQHDGLIPITEVQHSMLIHAGAQVRKESAVALGDYPDSILTLDLPPQHVEWVHVADKSICSDGNGTITVLDTLPAGVLLSGNSLARTFNSVIPGAVGIDSGSGYYLVSDTGLTHAIADGGSVTALGIAQLYKVPWSVLRVLPFGSELSKESALEAIY